jgi:hypothetical protein
MLESKIQKSIIKYLKDKRVYHFRFQAQVNLNGLPDIIALYKGYFIGLELKRPGGKPTGLQLKKIEAINENGGIGLVVDNIKDVKLIINLIDLYCGYKGETILSFYNKDRCAYEDSEQTKK